MKKITLLNPQQAKDLFVNYRTTRWSGNDQFCIKGVTDELDTILVNTETFVEVCYASILKVALKREYIIPLDEYGKEITLELKSIDEIGILLLIDSVPFLLGIYYDTSETNILEIGARFPELHIIDFGSTINENIKNLDSLLTCINLQILNLDDCPSLNDLSALPRFKKLHTLWIDGFMDESQFKFISKCENLINLSQSSCDLSCIEHLTKLKKLEVFECCSNLLTDLSPLRGLNSLTNLNLRFSTNLTDLSPISGLYNITKLYLTSCENLSDLSPISSLSNLIVLDLNFCYGLQEISPLFMLNSLQVLDMQCCNNLSNHKPFYGFNSLKSINMVAWDIKNLEIISKLCSLIKLDIHSCNELEDLSEISKLNNLEILDLSSCNKLNDVSSLSKLNNLKHLELSYCENLSNIDSISSLNELEFIGLNGCVSLRDVSALSNLDKLSFLDLMGCQKITLISKLSKLPLLKKLRLDETPNIRDFKQLMSLLQLRELSWIDEIACSEVLMSSSYNRLDILFIISNLNKWIQELLLCKDAVLFSSLLLNCISSIEPKTRKTHLAAVSTAMRKRGIESELNNDLDAFTWDTWCNLVLDLDADEAFACFELVVNELNIPRETEVILGSVVIAASEFIQKHPSEKEKTVQWVNEQLNQLESYPQEIRQIAPSAAVFFASLNKKEEVLYWLQKATDEKAPLWRERVILALVNYYANVGDFSEARRLLDEMQIQEEKDKAIASVANAMAANHPIEAGFLLDDIEQTNISTATALNLLQQPAMLREPQGIYQLLLHLQSNPDELATTLETMIQQDTEGKVASSLKQLFLTPQHSGPSAAVFLELCKHPTIGQFVKAWKLEELMNELQVTCTNEQKEQLSQFIDLLEQKKLIDTEEKPILIKKMKI